MTDDPRRRTPAEDPDDDTVVARPMTRRTSRTTSSSIDDSDEPVVSGVDMSGSDTEQSAGSDVDDHTVAVRRARRASASPEPVEPSEPDDRTVRMNRSTPAAEDTIGVRRAPPEAKVGPDIPQGRRSALIPDIEQLRAAGEPRPAAPVRAERAQPRPHGPVGADVGATMPGGDGSEAPPRVHRDVRADARRRFITVVAVAAGVVAIALAGLAGLVLSGL